MPTTLTLTIRNKKGRPLSSRPVEFVRCNRDWIWVADFIDHEQPVGQYNNDTGVRIPRPTDKYTYTLPPDEIKPLKPFSKLAYIKRTKPIRPAPVKKEKVKKVKPTLFHWRVVLASGKIRVFRKATEQEAIEAATKVSRGKPPQKVLSQVNKTSFRVSMAVPVKGLTEIGKIDV